MKISFVNPKGYLNSDPWMPLGAVQLATILAAQHDVRLFDEEQFDVPLDLVLDADVLCITGMSHQAGGIELWARLAREQGKRVVVGGVHASVALDELEGATVVAGPGEEILGCILEEPEPKPYYEAPPVEDMDTFPFPDRLRFGWHRYRERVGDLPAIRVVAARGCPFACKFCCNRRLTEGRLQLRKPEAVVEEIAQAQGQLGIKAVVFAMSVFTVSRTWALDVCKLLAKQGVQWKATTRVDLVDRELLQTMEKSGCIALGFGVESGSDRLLKIMAKGTTTAQATQAFAFAKEVGLPTFAMFMTHVPGETPVTLAATKRFAQELAPPLGATFQRFSPLPGSEFYDDLGKWGRVVGRKEDLGFGPVAFIPKHFLNES